MLDPELAWRDAYEMQMRAAVRPLQTGGGMTIGRCWRPAAQN
jgi:hypothetical protein